jgi:hypothetical protein
MDVTFSRKEPLGLARKGQGMPPRTLRVLAVALAVLSSQAAAEAAAPPADLRTKIFAAFKGVKSYKLTVLGSVRSLGVWVAPDKYQMTTLFQGKPLETIIIGKNFWTLSDDGKWEKSGTASNNLDVDIAGLLRTAKSDPARPFVKLPGQVQDGKPVGAFEFTFADGTQETCNYDPKTFLVTRCKADELTILYSGYNDPGNTVARLK